MGVCNLIFCAWQIQLVLCSCWKPLIEIPNQLLEAHFKLNFEHSTFLGLEWKTIENLIEIPFVKLQQVSSVLKVSTVALKITFICIHLYISNLNLPMELMLKRN